MVVTRYRVNNSHQTFENARDAATLRKILELKKRQKEEAMHIEDTQRG